jgi:para-nitrobenzyl esterase
MRILLFVLVGCSGSSAPTPPPVEDVVKTDKGEVQGILDSDTRRFLGIPFAAPPVDALRFQSPVPHDPWTTRLMTTAFANGCRQPMSPFTEVAMFSEDCLYLNVYTPRPPPAHAPVMVWLHGIGYLWGSPAEPMYEARKLARLGVVVVTLSYRVGTLGFLAYGGTSGRMGIEDQRMALKWVQTNIAPFGGDPAKVTLFGESGGGISTYVHIADPLSAGLFSRAIVESGFTDGAGIAHFPTQADAEAQGMALAAAVGCSDLACMQTKDPKMLGQALGVGTLHLGSTTGVFWWPAGPSPLSVIESGTFNKVPIILGTNGNEGTLFEALGGPATEADYMMQVQTQFGAGANAVLTQYPVSTFGSPPAAAAAVIGDALFVANSRRTARALTAAGVPVYRYSFERVPMFQPLPGIGSYHAGEIRFVFGSTLTGHALTADEETLGAVMRGQWVAMARDGKPGSDWPLYDAATDPYMEFNAGAVAKMGLKTAQSDLWDSLAP